MKGQYYTYSYFYAVIFLLSLVTDSYNILSLALTSIVLVSILDKLGKGVVLRELIALHLTVICLVMPIVGYAWYTRDFYLAAALIKYMQVSETTYFSYALPAVSVFILVLCWPLKEKFPDYGKYLDSLLIRIRTKLSTNKNVGIYLLVVGVVASVLASFLPVSLRYVATLFYWSSFAGFLYVYFSPKFKARFVILTLFTLFVVASAIRTGLFTIVAYMGITLFSLLFLGRKISFTMKACLMAAGIFFLLALQSVKSTYREQTWTNEFEGSKSELFLDLLENAVTDPTQLFIRENFFFLYLRANQGYNVALVMRRFPEYKQHDYGINLLQTIASSLVPRFIWPDKPKAGGKYNMAYYTGLQIEGWSTNVGPLGEAYGSFGVFWGIVYMGILAFIIRYAYSLVFKLTRPIPLILFWIPVMFYQVTYSSETDTLQILNSLIKSSVFVWLLYKFAPSLFGISKGPGRQFAPADNSNRNGHENSAVVSGT